MCPDFPDGGGFRALAKAPNDAHSTGFPAPRQGANAQFVGFLEASGHGVEVVRAHDAVEFPVLMGKAQRAARHPEFPVNGPVGRPLLLAEQRVPGPVIRAECGLLPQADEESRQVRQAGVDLCEVPVAARFVAPIVGATTSYVTRSTLRDTGTPLTAVPSFVLRIRLASCSSLVPVHFRTVRWSRSIRLPQIRGRLAFYA